MIKYDHVLINTIRMIISYAICQQMGVLVAMYFYFYIVKRLI